MAREKKVVASDALVVPVVGQKRPRDVEFSEPADNSTVVKAPKLIVNSIPHNILFAQALPDSCTPASISNLFSSYPGFKEVRMVPGKKGIAFIEFGDQIQASIALQQLNGFVLSTDDSANDNVLHLTYGKQ